ncbi:MAG: helix-turn-helix transcriptional regulator [Ruminococcaceae bacterium]|nr:helix-turn-helix transcriptional regulator [Oscillospiraceae bacterium]
MTFGQKLKEARKAVGLSQEQFSEKMNVSRSAVAKWESDKGMPDISNLKAIAQLLNVSVDYLLDDNGVTSVNELKEAISLDDYKVSGKCRNKYDAVVVAKFPSADSVYPLIRKKVLSKKEWLLDFFTQPGVLNVADSMQDMSAYYIVENNGKQFFVNVTKEFITVKETSKRITDNKFVIGQNKFIRCAYTVN